MTTENMDLDLPVVGSTPGPTYATKIKQALETIDEHDHSSGKGVKIPASGLNIQTDLELNGNQLTETEAVEFTSQSATLSGNEKIYSVEGELYFNNDAGTPVKITSGSGLNLASTGTIGGDYGGVGVNADVSYSDLSKVFSFTRESGVGAEITGSDLNLQYPATGTAPVTIKPPNITSGSYDITLPPAQADTDDVIAFTSAGVASFRSIDGTTGELTVSKSGTAFTLSLPSTIANAKTFSADNTHSGNNTFSGANNFTGNTTGRGILPVGAIIAMNTNLTGVTAVTATTAADANGFVVCSGQVISDATSPMNGQTIPNLNDSYFLMGASSSGSTGGANTTTLTTTQLPAHSHTIDHGHSNTFALSNNTVASSSHTHTIAHVHQITHAFDTGGGTYSQRSLASRSSSTLSFSTSGSQSLAFDITTNGGTGAGQRYAQINNSASNYYTAGATDDSGNASNSGTPSATSTVTLTGSVTSHSGSSGSSGTGSSYDSRPKFFAVKFVMRIK
jgi:hypothetical protein